MGIMEIIGLAGSVSLLAGWRLYLCIFATGLAMRLELLPLPEHLTALDALANPWVMGVAAVVDPHLMAPSVLSLHVFVMVAFTLVLFEMTYDYDGKGELSRVEGGALFTAYLSYFGYVLVQNV